MVKLLGVTGMTRGYQIRIAEAVGVSPATICRDIAKLLRGPREETEAERTARTLAMFDRRAKLEDEMEEAAEEHRLPADPVAIPSGFAAVRPQSDDEQVQVPRWLPAARHVGTRRMPSMRHVARRTC